MDNQITESRPESRCFSPRKTLLPPPRQPLQLFILRCLPNVITLLIHSLLFAATPSPLLWNFNCASRPFKKCLCFHYRRRSRTQTCDSRTLHIAGSMNRWDIMVVLFAGLQNPVINLARPLFAEALSLSITC
jgi:hypothetical protein